MTPRHTLAGWHGGLRTLQAPALSCDPAPPIPLIEEQAADHQRAQLSLVLSLVLSLNLSLVAAILALEDGWREGHTGPRVLLATRPFDVPWYTGDVRSTRAQGLIRRRCGPMQAKWGRMRTS